MKISNGRSEASLKPQALQLLALGVCVRAAERRCLDLDDDIPAMLHWKRLS